MCNFTSVDGRGHSYLDTPQRSTQSSDPDFPFPYTFLVVKSSNTDEGRMCGGWGRLLQFRAVKLDEDVPTCEESNLFDPSTTTVLFSYFYDITISHPSF